MRSKGYGSWSVCLSVHCYSGTTVYDEANEWHHRLQNNEDMDMNLAIFLKQLRSRDMV